MQILIKSFNRPYYLDRCLSSIKKYVVGYDKVLIMDDGTPEKYLQTILKKYAFVEFIYSASHIQKRKFIENETPILTGNIPSKLWLDCAKSSSYYFVVLEDDMWFTANINLIEIGKQLEENKIELLKLFWLGNRKLVNYQQIKKVDSIEFGQPRSSIFNINYFYWIYFRFQRLNNLKSFLGLYNKDELLDYYSIYGVAGMIFKKDYYLALWRNDQLVVNEMQQLKNGLSYIKTKGDFFIAKMANEVLKTGFISAATNANKLHYKQSLDMFTFNQILNELWLNDGLNAVENFPNDFSEAYIFELIRQNHPELAEKWLIWHQEFRQQYLNLGCII